MHISKDKHITQDLVLRNRFKLLNTITNKYEFEVELRLLQIVSTHRTSNKVYHNAESLRLFAI